MQSLALIITELKIVVLYVSDVALFIYFILINKAESCLLSAFDFIF